MDRATPSTPNDSDSPDVEREMGLPISGVLLGIGSYVTWGIAPVYYKSVRAAPPLEILAHRVIWTVMLLAILLTLIRGWRGAWRSLASRRTLLTLAMTTVLIGSNWYMFTWAINNDRVIEASLGYYINPLVSVLFGYVFLRERLSGAERVAVVLAGLGVAWFWFDGRIVPVVSLFLAVTFALYGLLRKVVRVDSIAGLSVEAMAMFPLALCYLIWLNRMGTGHFAAGSTSMTLLLPVAGLMTAVPLLLFTMAARRLRLTTVGLLQYISPSLHLMLAVMVYDEPFTRTHVITFGCIWAALAVYTVQAVLRVRTATKRK